MKKLVYYFYIGENWDTNKANLTHFECLKRYNEVFDEIEIYLAIDNKEDTETINQVEKIFLEIFKKAKSVLFKIVDNTVYRESLIVKEYIIDKLGEDDLVFSAHNKGFTDITNPNYNEEFVLTWIIGCYYFSLENIKEVTEHLYFNPTILSHGSFLTQLQAEEGSENKQLGKYKWYYVGNFFWINSKKIKNYMDRNNIVPPLLGDRYYAENILGNLFPVQLPGSIFASSKNAKFIIKVDNSFVDIRDHIHILYNEDKNFIMDFVNEMLTNTKK